jgi:hypothetical protein
MGNVASSLLRLSNWVRLHRKDEAIVQLRGEIARFMEWNGGLALREPADMQRGICRWRRIWPEEQARALLALCAPQMSHQVLEVSGLVDSMRS